MSKRPTISIGNLVEYASTPSASRRRAIIEQYHEVNVIRLNWHGASDAIFAARASGYADADALIDLEKQRVKEQLSGDKERDRRPRHILHLIDLLEASDLQKLTAGLDVTSAGELATDCNVGPLTVRVRPNLLLSSAKIGARGSSVGIMKCHYLSSYKLGGDAGSMYAVAIQIYAEQALEKSSISPDLCRIYDLFDDKLYKAPARQTRARTRLYESALEISDRWEAVGKRLYESRAAKRKSGT